MTDKYDFNESVKELTISALKVREGLRKIAPMPKKDKPTKKEQSRIDRIYWAR